MATDKTRSVSGRVPVEIAEALEVDAGELGIKPGTLLRKLLEGRYAVPSGARKSNMTARKEGGDLVELPDD